MVYLTQGYDVHEGVSLEASRLLRRIMKLSQPTDWDIEGSQVKPGEAREMIYDLSGVHRGAPEKTGPSCSTSRQGFFE